MKLLSTRRGRLAAVAGVLALVTAGGVAYAAIPGPGGVIQACYTKSGGALRVVDSAASCKSGETSLNWSQQGLPGPVGPAGPAGAQGPVGPAGPGSLFAVVASDGALARGSTGVTSTHLSAGSYSVDFGKDVTDCAYVATPGDIAAGSLVAPAAATVARRAGNANAVFVAILDNTGAFHDDPFHLIVAC
jgi:hypothetical protein